jgi:hypothetical protein
MPGSGGGTAEGLASRWSISALCCVCMQAQTLGAGAEGKGRDHRGARITTASERQRRPHRSTPKMWLQATTGLTRSQQSPCSTARVIQAVQQHADKARHCASRNAPLVLVQVFRFGSRRCCWTLPHSAPAPQPGTHEHQTMSAMRSMICAAFRSSETKMARMLQMHDRYCRKIMVPGAVTSRIPGGREGPNERRGSKRRAGEDARAG